MTRIVTYQRISGFSPSTKVTTFRESDGKIEPQNKRDLRSRGPSEGRNDFSPLVYWRVQNTGNKRRLKLKPETRNAASGAVLAIFCTLSFKTSPLFMRLRTGAQAAQLAAGAGFRPMAQNRAAPFPRQGPVDGLHSLENRGDKVGGFCLTSPIAGVKRHSFLSNF